MVPLCQSIATVVLGYAKKLLVCYGRFVSGLLGCYGWMQSV